MAFVLFSSMDGQSEVYVYESVHGGYVTHVAKTRVTFKQELPPQVPFDLDYCEEWLARHRKVSDMLSKADLNPIGLPHDGEVFVDYTAFEAANRLESLKAIGYRVPEDVIKELREEGNGTAQGAD